jgi:hypothetical protein
MKKTEALLSYRILYILCLTHNTLLKQTIEVNSSGLKLQSVGTLKCTLPSAYHGISVANYN